MGSLIFKSFLDYIYQSGQRQYELPNTPGHTQKIKYIEKMIAKLPEDRSEQYKLFGFRRDWLIEFYMQSTKGSEKVYTIFSTG